MAEHMELGLALTLCGLGAGFLIPSFILAWIDIRKRRYCTATATAVVVNIVTKNSENGLSFHPVYEYVVGGTTYSNMGAYISHRVPEKGSVIEIKYNPDKPKQSYIVGYDTKVYRTLSVIFGIIGMIPILVCIGIAVFF